MKYIFILFLFIAHLSGAQSLPNDSSDYFDFWVGKWQATWDEGDGKVGKGTNHIEKTLDGKVIRESFAVVEGRNKGFKGTSISVFNPRRKSWHQAWADNQGGYFDFTGEVDGEKRIFKTRVFDQPDGSQVVQRMVFYDITGKTMTWDWESSKDGGKTWKLNWRVNYERVE